MSQYHTVFITVALQYSLQSGSLISPASFFHKFILAIRGLLCFYKFYSALFWRSEAKLTQFYPTLCEPMDYTGVGSLSLLHGIFPTQGSNPGLPHFRQILHQLSRLLVLWKLPLVFDSDCIKSVDCLGYHSQQTILILPIQEQYIFPPVCIIFSLFLQCLIVFGKQDFCLLGSFVYKCFVLWDVMINGIFFLCSLSGILLLVYRSAAYFCMLVFYPATLLKSLIISSSFRVVP